MQVPLEGCPSPISSQESTGYILRIVARNDKDDRTSVSRGFFIGNGSHCAVHLINSGLTVYGDNARVEFTTSGLPVTGIRCKVDSQEFPCKYDWKLMGDRMIIKF